MQNNGIWAEWKYYKLFIINDVVLCLNLYFKLAQEKFDFFPLNRALSLSAMDEGSTDSKVDDLLRYVTLLVEKQREEVSQLPTNLPCGISIGGDALF